MPERTVLLLQPSQGPLAELKRRPALPLSLLSAARGLSGSWELLLVDQRLPRWRSRFAAALRSKPGLVAVTAVTGPQLAAAVALCRRVRLESTAPIVWGGPHASLLPEQLLRSGLADWVVVGEGERAFPALAEALTEDRDPGSIPGIVGLSRGRVVSGGAPEPVDLDELAPIPWRLAGSRYLFETQGRPTALVESSRGCSARCRFCYNSHVYRGLWRGMSPDAFIAQLRQLLNELPTTRHLYVVDDDFFADPERVWGICEALGASGMDLTWQLQGARVAALLAMDDADLHRLRRAGCTRVDIGAESGSPRILAKLHKGFDPGQLRALNRRLAAADIAPWYNFMAGFPGETVDDLQATAEQILALTADNPRALVSPVYLYTPWPGTPMAREAEAYGYRPPSSLEDWVRLDWSRSPLPDLPADLRRRIHGLHTMTLFVDDKAGAYGTGLAGRALTAAYRPIARRRLRAGLANPMLERLAFGVLRRAANLPGFFARERA